MLAAAVVENRVTLAVHVADTAEMAAAETAEQANRGQMVPLELLILAAVEVEVVQVAPLTEVMVDQVLLYCPLQDLRLQQQVLQQ
jgi:hypothetical protein